MNRPANQTCQTAVALTVNATTGTTGTSIGANQTYHAGLEGVRKARRTR